MEKPQNRRNFLKTAGIAAGLLQIPLIGWSSDFTSLLSIGLNPSEEFSLVKMKELLSGYKFPFAEKFSTDAFRLSYQLYNLYGRNAAYSGAMSLQSRLNQQNAKFLFSVKRLANNGITNKGLTYNYVVKGEVNCKTDETFSPQKWEVASMIALQDHPNGYGGTELKSAGKIQGGELLVRAGSKQIRKHTGSGPLSWKWGIMAVVQKMAKEQVSVLNFSTLDEFDTIYEHQKLRFRKNITIDCGDDRLIDFKLFELTGDGVIPTVYWTDHLNRVVFVISGMEAFVLEQTVHRN